MADKTDDLVISISTDVATIKRQLKQLEGLVNQTSGSFERSFKRAGKSMDTAFSATSGVQDRINKLTGVATQAAKEWEGALANQGKELERLRSKYNPIFAAVKQYKASVVDIQQAHRVGAISADEMTAAIQRERQATLASIAAIKQRGTAIRQTQAGAFNTANIASQFQDIGVTAAMGMNPLQIALQQGTQLSMVLETMKADGRSAGAALAAAFGSVISPLSLVTIGLVAAAAAGTQYFFSMDSGIEKLDKIIKEHKEAIERLGPAYEKAAKGAQNYTRESANVINALLKDAAEKANKELQTEISKTLLAIKVMTARGDANFAPFQGMIDSLKSGTITALEFRDAATTLGNSNPALAEAAALLRAASDNAADATIKIGGMTTEVDAAANAASKMAVALQQGIDSGLSRLTDEQVKYVQGLIEKLHDGKMSAEDFKRAMEALDGVSPDFSGAIQQISGLADEMERAQRAALGLANTVEKQDRVGFNRMDAAQSQYDDALALAKRLGIDGVTKDSKKLPKTPATKAPRRTAEDRFFEDIERIRQRTAALAQEREMIGQTFEEQTKRRVAFDLEAQALRQVREEARRKGNQDWQNAQLTPNMVKQIDNASSAYARQAEELRKAQVAHAEFEDWMNVGRSATRGFIQDMLNGVDAGEAFANVLGKIGDKLLDLAMNDLWGAGGSGGNGIIGSLIGGLLGGIGGGSSDPWAGLRENGGPVRKGGAYIVGEKRPELFVPDQNGTIVPRVPKIAMGGGAGAMYVSVTLSPTIDNRGASVEAVARTQQQLDRLKAELPAHVTQAVRKAQKSNVKLG